MLHPQQRADTKKVIELEQPGATWREDPSVGLLAGGLYKGLSVSHWWTQLAVGWGQAGSCSPAQLAPLAAADNEHSCLWTQSWPLCILL